MIHDPIPRGVQPALPLFDEEALDIADYLKSEVHDDDIHSDETRKHGVAALTLGAIGVVYGDIGTSPIYAFREASRLAADPTDFYHLPRDRVVELGERVAI